MLFVDTENFVKLKRTVSNSQQYTNIDPFCVFPAFVY